MNITDFLNNFNFFINFKLISFEEIVIILLSYNFIKILIFNSIFELIWPTQFFNKRHSINNKKNRSFTENLLKLIYINLYYKVFNKNLLKYYFFKK